MEFQFQQCALKQLQKLADYDSHSIIISGISGIGKTYLAKQYAAMKNIETFNVVSSKVSDLKSSLDSSYRLSEVQVLCIENLDKGTDAASQVILKYLEEPLPNTYVIVTATNISALPSTILSRAIAVIVEPPSKEELELFGNNYNSNKNKVISKYAVYQNCKSLSDVKTLIDLDLTKLQYYDSLLDNKLWKDSVSSISWALSHFQDNSPTDLKVVFKLFLNHSNNQIIKSQSLEALLALESGTISESAIINKFVIAVKIN